MSQARTARVALEVPAVLIDSSYCRPTPFSLAGNEIIANH